MKLFVSVVWHVFSFSMFSLLSAIYISDHLSRLHTKNRASGSWHNGGKKNKGYMCPESKASDFACSGRK